MEFTYRSYEKLIHLLTDSGYEIADYHNYNGKCVILRHDIDYSLEKALQMAEFEKSGGVKSTYFVLLTSDFYNVHSRRSRNVLDRIMNLGHEIGLHFDETCYPDASSNDLIYYINKEKGVLGDIIDKDITTLSMHRPSKIILENDIQIPNLVNSYSNIFFKEFKYLSDSRMRWREPAEDIIRSGEFDRFQILTHAIWYSKDATALSMREVLLNFINESKSDRYEFLNENFTDLKDVIKKEELIGT